MRRKWRRAWLRGKPHYMRYKPVRILHTGNIKSMIYDLTVNAVKKLVPAAAAAGVLLSSMTGVQANPIGGNIAAGTGSISGQGTKTVVVNQSSDKLSINWNSFCIANGEKVQFIQPGASSIALNRVMGNNASAIYGQLSANGKVFLINPNGVLFAKSAQVNVGGLVASTLQLNDEDFMNGKYTFSGDSRQGVLNQGNITAMNGGYVALLGVNAANEGVVLAKEGAVVLGAGSKVSLDFAGDGLLTLSVDESKVRAEVKNSGLIQADGGLVVMNAKAAEFLTGSVVNNTGTVEAKSVTSKNGAIILTGDTVTNTGALDASGKSVGESGGTVKVLGDIVTLSSGSSVDVTGDNGGGTALIGGAYQGGAEYTATNTVVEQGATIGADALATGKGGQIVVWSNDNTSFAGAITAKGGKTSGDGGRVEVSGKKSLFYNGHTNTTAAHGKTGSLLLDPGEYVIDNSVTSGNVKQASELAAELENNNITLKTDGTGTGDIIVSTALEWSGSNTLTLDANHNIAVNADINAVNGGLTLISGGSISAPAAVNVGVFTLNGGAWSQLGSLPSFCAKDFRISGGTFLRALNGDGAATPYQINDVYGLQGIGSIGMLGKNYQLVNDIDASGTKT